MTRLFLAGNYEQAFDAARDLPPGSWRYIGERRDLLGRRDGSFVVVGTFWERRDAHELYDTARAQGLTEADR